MAPILVWAISLLGFPFFPPITDGLWSAIPISNYDAETQLNDEIAGTGFGDEGAATYLQYTPLDHETVQAAAVSTASIDNRFWSYGGKHLATCEAISAIQANRASSDVSASLPFELNCLNHEQLQTTFNTVEYIKFVWFSTFDPSNWF